MTDIDEYEATLREDVNYFPLILVKMTLLSQTLSDASKTTLTCMFTLAKK